MSENGNSAGFGAGLFVGMLVGASLALLYAPRPGRETRALLRQKAEESRGRAEEIIEKARERTRKIVEDARGTSSEPGAEVIP